MSERKIGFDRATLGDKIAEETDARAKGDRQDGCKRLDRQLSGDAPCNRLRAREAAMDSITPRSA
jgi:hypothetical protein